VAPYLGSVLYVLFGINRIRRKARTLRRGRNGKPGTAGAAGSDDRVAAVLGPEASHLRSVARLVGRVTDRPLLPGNQIDLLIDGDETYPAMLEAIERAQRSLSLSTYIFYDDPVGQSFVAALGRAVKRGVAVRVLIDDVGARYRWRTIQGPLRAAGVPVATFIPTMVPGSFHYLNLRNHRKILVSDGALGFTGGMNIDATFVHQRPEGIPYPRRQHHDLHFRVEGPVVAELQQVFAEDWSFSTGERLSGDVWFPAIAEVGPIVARCVDDGPDEDTDPLLMTLLGAVAAARSSICIMTPYFLPDEALITALEVAALRGVTVDIIIPRRSNLRFVEWATPPFLERVLEGGCRVWSSSPPFDHSRLTVVDGAWVFVGSANIDARSLRLNFEVNLECYGREFANEVAPFIARKLQCSTAITLAQLRALPFPMRLRNATFRLLAPYL
jgi:cardiolipin synthase